MWRFCNTIFGNIHVHVISISKFNIKSIYQAKYLIYSCEEKFMDLCGRQWYCYWLYQYHTAADIFKINKSKWRESANIAGQPYQMLCCSWVDILHNYWNITRLHSWTCRRTSLMYYQCKYYTSIMWKIQNPRDCSWSGQTWAACLFCCSNWTILTKCRSLGMHRSLVYLYF